MDKLGNMDGSSTESSVQMDDGVPGGYRGNGLGPACGAGDEKSGDNTGDGAANGAGIDIRGLDKLTGGLPTPVADTAMEMDVGTAAATVTGHGSGNASDAGLLASSSS